MKIGMVGLGRMGGNMARRLTRAKHECVGFAKSAKSVEALAKEGVLRAKSLEDLVGQLPKPRAIWLMVPAAAVDEMIDALAPKLDPGDIIIDGGNSYYRDDIRRAKALTARQGIHYVDVGTSGGVWGLERGYCLMIGGERRRRPAPGPDLRGAGAGRRRSRRARLVARSAVGTAEQGYLHCGPSGAGHFVKMVHNGIEYGIMAAYAEGMNILRHADAGKHPRRDRRRDGAAASSRALPVRIEPRRRRRGVAARQRHRFVAARPDRNCAAQERRPGRASQGRVSDSGEGRWTVKAAIDEGVPAHVLDAAINERFASRGEDDFADRLLSAMRYEFGGHREKHLR